MNGFRKALQAYEYQMTSPYDVKELTEEQEEYLKDLEAESLMEERWLEDK